MEEKKKLKSEAKFEVSWNMSFKPVQHLRLISFGSDCDKQSTCAVFATLDKYRL